MRYGQLLAILTVCPLRMMAEVVTLGASADTHLIQPTNNNLGAYPWFSAGTSGTSTTRRGLLEFDLSAIPPGSIINSATLSLEVVLVPGFDSVASDFALHRMLTDWNEGNKVSASPSGLPASPGEATWLQSGVSAWGVNGGESGVDYLAAASASTAVDGLGSYEWSGPTMVSDVQIWVGNPTQNAGWMLLSQSEGILKTARRFGSREEPNPSFQPSLVVDFTPPPDPECPVPTLLIARRGAEVELSWESTTGCSYQLQSSTTLMPADWGDVGPAASGDGTTRIALVPITGDRQFFRVAIQALQGLPPRSPDG